MYKHILVAVDLDENSSHILSQAATLANLIGASLSVAHVIEPIKFSYGDSIPVDLNNLHHQLREAAHLKLKEISSSHGIADEGQYVLEGVPRNEIISIVDEKSVDLLVLGGELHHWMPLFFGSKTSGLIHDANCDVLALKCR